MPTKIPISHTLAATFLLPACILLGCDADLDGEGATDTDGASASPVPLTAEEVAPVAEHYAALVHATYADSVTTARALDAALEAFTGEPSAATHEAAKQAWLTAREPYGQTEAFRFYGGPIDDEETGREGQLNAWPLDEAYVDYVEDMPNTGIVNDPSIEISAESLVALNEQGGEENVATGYHAIEFLLWGQDMSSDGPGQRSHEDFLDGGSAANPDRRRLYLTTVGDLLVEDLSLVAQAWDPSETGNYREAFLANPPEQIVQDIMRGIGALAGAELAEERINVAFDTKLQEEEHSCFSDNTHNDILYNFLSVKNVYYGEYGSLKGPGVDELVRARDAALADEIDAKFEAVQAHIETMPAPFDAAIAASDEDPRRAAIEVIIDDLRELGDLFVRGAAMMDITLNTALE